jgi:hypothetical protein
MQTYEVGKYQISDQTAILLEAWYGALKGRYEDFDEFVRSAGRKEVEPFMDQPAFSKYVLDYLKAAGRTVDLKIPASLYDALEAEAKEQGFTIERLVEKMVENNVTPDV